jgi:hypothetical protein
VAAEVSPRAKVSPEREWWLRTLAVFQSPRAVFAALRDDSQEQAAARQEPVLALVLLAGMEGILLTDASGRFLDEPLADDSLAVAAVLVFLAGAIYGAASYWLGGALLHVGLRGAGGSGSYRQARHLLAFAAVPLALSLVVVWPVRLAVYGGDSFRTGGADEGAGKAVFDALSAVFVAWALGLLALGIAVVNRWSVLRALVSLALVLLAVLVITLPFVVTVASS